MMNLNRAKIANTMREKGLSQADVATALSVSREAVSKWMRGTSTPRAGRILRVANLLGLGFDDIYEKPQQAEPVVAFRKKGSAKTTVVHHERAKDMGFLLKNLVDYLPFDTLSQPASLINPQATVEYVEKAAADIRRRMRLSTDVVDFTNIIQFFAEVHTVLVPVMWGKKEQHENALHIYLPDSMTTWVYLNLDVNVMDFKFWMAHELAHVKAPTLPEPDAEIFADMFASELLFPTRIAERYAADLRKIENAGILITKIQEIATEFLISPITVLTQLNRAAQTRGFSHLEVNIHPSTTNFNKRFLDLSKTLFGTSEPAPSSFVRISKDAFKTSFFDVLSSYLRKTKKQASFVQRVLNIGPIDAKNLYTALIRDDAKDSH